MQENGGTDKEVAKLLEQLMGMSLADIPEASKEVAAQVEPADSVIFPQFAGKSATHKTQEAKRETLWEICYKILKAGSRLTQKMLLEQYIGYLKELKAKGEAMKIDQ